MKVYESIRELIGETPLLRLKTFEPHSGVKLYAKLELMNPGGSVKDRIGLSMIDAAERTNQLTPGGTIVEATAGNTGIGIAIAALEKHYRVIFTVPEKFSVEKITLMKALGAEVIQTPGKDGMVGAIEMAESIRRQIPGAISLKQFENPANPEVHFETTGQEIYKALGPHIDYFVAGAGSGGTVTGISKYLKLQNPKLKTIIADPLGSTMGGGPQGCYDIEGIGNHFIPETLDMSVIDEFVSVTDAEAFHYVQRLASQEGILAGSSSGAALAATLKVAARLESGTLVTVFPDRGDRYFSKQLYER